MENNRFFKFLWRANAVFLFVAGISLIGLLGMSAFFLASEFTHSDTPPPAISAATNDVQDENPMILEFGGRYGQKNVEGFVYFELRAGADSYSKLGSGSSSQLRNIAIFDLAKDTTRWVFPDSQQEIESFKPIRKAIKTEAGKKTTITTGFLLTVAKSLPDQSISRDLWAMRTDGHDLRKVLSDVPRSPDLEKFGENKIRLIIGSKTHIDVYHFDVDMLTVGQPTRVSIP